MPYVKRTAAGRISAVFDRPSRDAKERVRANDPELLKFLGLAPTQSVDTTPAETGLEPNDYAVPLAVAQTDDSYVAPPVYDDAFYDESQNFVDAEEDNTIAFESPPTMPDVPLKQNVSDTGVDTEFSLPDDMPNDTAEVHEARDEIDLEGIESVPKPPNDRARPKIEVAPEADGPNFESKDNSSSSSSPCPASPQTEATIGPSETPQTTAQAETDVTNDEDEASGNIDGTALRQLDESDLEMARITEDLIDLLIGRNIINFTDFPGMAQAKLINRRALRSNMSALTNLVSDEENIF